jgi:hypothetical protein
VAKWEICAGPRKGTGQRGCADRFLLIEGWPVGGWGALPLEAIGSCIVAREDAADERSFLDRGIAATQSGRGGGGSVGREGGLEKLGQPLYTTSSEKVFMEAMPWRASISGFRTVTSSRSRLCKHALAPSSSVF